jgi:hypothetical protein
MGFGTASILRALRASRSMGLASQFAPNRSQVEPVAILFLEGCIGVTPGQKLVQSVTRFRLRLNHQTTSLNGKINRCANLQME